MKLIDWILLLIIAAAVLLSLRVMHRNRGKGCGGQCSGCTHACSCGKKDEHV